MNAAEAAEKYIADRGVLAFETTRATIRDWFAANWPAGGAVTFDVEAVAREIATDLEVGCAYGEKRSAVIAQILRRHAAAPAGAQVVEVTGEDVRAAIDEQPAMDLLKSGWRDVLADRINARLRARAGTARHATGAQWVHRPQGQASVLVVPETGHYVRKFDGEIADGVYEHEAGYEIASSRVSAIRRIDTDAPTTWIERPASTGEWTPESVAACDQRDVVVIIDGKLHTMAWINADTRDIAASFNRRGVTAYYILPPVEAQP